MTEGERADRLVAAAARRLGAPPRSIGSSEDVSFGEFGFALNKDQHVLRGRVFIMNLWTPLDPPERRQRFREAVRLMDPPGPGMLFEHGGGRFFLDEGQAKLFLVKDYPLDMDPQAFAQDFENLVEIGATWAAHWVTRVMKIGRGEEAPPSAPVTRKSIEVP